MTQPTGVVCAYGRSYPLATTHLKHCEGFPKDDVATSSSDHEPPASASKGSPHHPSTRAHHMQPNTSSQSGSQPKVLGSREAGHKRSKRKRRSRDRGTNVREDKQDKGHSCSDRSRHK